MSISQRAQTKRDKFGDRKLLKLTRDHHYLKCTSRQGLLYSSGVEHRDCDRGVNKDTRKFNSKLESGFYKQLKRED